MGPSAHVHDVVRLPSRGWSKEEVMKQAQIYLGLGEFDWKEGSQSGTVYNGNDELTQVRLGSKVKALEPEKRGITLSSLGVGCSLP